MRHSEGTIMHPLECAPKPLVVPAKAGTQRVGEAAPLTNALPSPRRSGEGRNPEGWWSRSFAREKMIEGWRRTRKGEMIVKGNWGWRDICTKV